MSQLAENCDICPIFSSKVIRASTESTLRSMFLSPLKLCHFEEPEGEEHASAKLSTPPAKSVLVVYFLSFIIYLTLKFNFFKPSCTSGQLIKSFHNKPVRWFSIIGAMVSWSMAK